MKFFTQTFLLYFIFLLRFFEEVPHRESYAVPNSKNIHVPTPHEQIIVLQLHFKTKEISIHFIINKATPKLFSEITAKPELTMSL
jgi:hypothetical protein